MPNYRALKISRKHYKMYQVVLYLVVPYSQNYAARIHGLYHECSECFEYPQKSLLRSRHPKNYLPNFPTPKNPRIKNFHPTKTLPLSPSLEIRSTPPPPAPTQGPTCRLWPGKFWCFKSSVTYARWSLTKAVCTWKFDCISTVWEMSLCSSF